MGENEKTVVKNQNKPIFRDLSVEDASPETTVIESLCMNCGENGTTRLLLTKIPHYKDVILMSFNCEHCGFENNEIQSGGKINEKGVNIKLNVSTERDLNRQIVKSDYTSIRIPELDFEIPALSQKGEVTTVEGIIDRAVRGLQQDQERRREENPEAAEQIDNFIARLQNLKLLTSPFTIHLEDVSGQTHVENPKAPMKDPDCIVSHFVRSEEQNKMLGIFAENTDDTLLKPIDPASFPLEDLEGEVLTFPTNCPQCNTPCSTNMKMTNIPHFKEVVIMATVCESCGHRTNEVKSGSGIEPQGVRIEVQVTGRDDFSRDVLKSETCSLELPELEFDVGPMALGGRFTTVEGILSAMKEQLTGSSVITGDSGDPEAVQRMEKFIAKLDGILAGERSVTLVLDDPAGNSYVQSLADEGCDEKLKISKYERNFEQNEELGLNDMKVEGY